MGLTGFTLRIILIFLPGIAAFMIVERLTSHEKFKIHKIILNSFTIGFLCYLLYFVIIKSINLFTDLEKEVSFLKALVNKDTPLDFNEIVLVVILAIPVGFVISYLANRNVIYKFAKKLHVTKKFGNNSVWSFLLESKIPGWVTIRDVKNDFIYEGWISVYSDDYTKDELFLEEVCVYENSTGKKLYEVEGLYLCKNKEDLLFEFPVLQEKKQKKEKKRDA